MPQLTSNLDANEPAFIQRLKGQFGNSTGRLERPIERPRKPKNDDDDDEPTYVDEESHEVISKEEYKSLVRESNHKEDDDPTKEAGDKEQAAHGSDEKDNTNAGKDAPATKQKLAEIGGPKKRKQAKVIGEENKAPDDPEVEKEQQEAPTTRKPKQKKKKIKLSFDEEQSLGYHCYLTLYISYTKESGI